MRSTTKLEAESSKWDQCMFTEAKCRRAWDSDKMQTKFLNQMIFVIQFQISTCFLLYSSSICRLSRLERCETACAIRIRLSRPCFRMSSYDNRPLLVYSFESPLKYVDALEIQKQLQSERIRAKTSSGSVKVSLLYRESKVQRCVN